MVGPFFTYSKTSLGPTLYWIMTAVFESAETCKLFIFKPFTTLGRWDCGQEGWESPYPPATGLYQIGIFSLNFVFNLFSKYNADRFC